MEKTSFPFVGGCQLKIAPGMGMGHVSHLSSRVALVQTVQACAYCLSLHVHASPVDLQSCVGVSYISSCTYTLSPSSSVDSLTPEGRDVMETSHVGLRVPGLSLSACCLAGVSVCVPVCCRRSLSDDGRAGH